MKATLIVLGLIAAVAYAEEGKAVFKKCPDFKLQHPELRSKVYYDEVTGPWHLIRIGPSKETAFLQMDCHREIYYRDDKDAENTLRYVRQIRKGNETKVITGVSKYSGVVGKEIDNYFENTFQDLEDNTKEIRSEAVLIDTDGGETWGIWVGCVEIAPSNTAVAWGIFSRYPWIDARVEQKLVEKIEKLGGVGPTQLRGIGQTDCYKVHK